MAKIVGILGGMGPLASLDLQLKIIENTVAQKDQDHLHVITDCHSQIPDRTEAILHGGEDPLPKLLESVERLDKAGAQVLIMACNTAHYYLNEMKKHTSVPFLSIVETAAEAARKTGAKRVAVFSTTATQAIGLYEKACRERGMEVLDLSKEDNELVMHAVYELKAGEMHARAKEMKKLLDRKRAEGAELFLLACTELPIYFRKNELEGIFIDPTEELAREVIVYAGGEVKEK